MSAVAGSTPVRSCVGCRQRRPSIDLVRVTRSPDGIEVDGASNGRGAWLCRSSVAGRLVDEACAELAISRRGFGRAWRCSLAPADEQRVRDVLARHLEEHPDAH